MKTILYHFCVLEEKDVVIISFAEKNLFLHQRKRDFTKICVVSHRDRIIGITKLWALIWGRPRYARRGTNMARQMFLRRYLTDGRERLPWLSEIWYAVKRRGPGLAYPRPGVKIRIPVTLCMQSWRITAWCLSCWGTCLLPSQVPVRFSNRAGNLFTVLKNRPYEGILTALFMSELLSPQSSFMSTFCYVLPWCNLSWLHED